MSDDFTLRQYRQDDSERILRLHEEAMRGVDALAEESVFAEVLPDDEELDGDLQTVRETYIEPGGEFLIGELDEKTVAMGAFKPVDDSVAEIKRMRVDPDHQRQGYGQQVLDALEAGATERGFAVFVLDTTARQTGARQLYEANGYREVRRETIGEYEVLFYRKSTETASMDQ